MAFVAHPLHFERTPPGAYSGELVVSADVVLTVEAFRQGVIDMLGTANWLRAGGHEVRCYPSAVEFLAARPGSSSGCVLLDLQMPGPSGLDLQDALIKGKAHCPSSS